MAGTIKGMTIEIGGNTAPLEQALKDTNKEINATQKELKEVNKLLKFDPENVTLLKQKQELLTDAIGKTTTKLDALKQAQAQLDEKMKNGGEVNAAEYRKLEREIATTESSLNKLKDEAKKTGDQMNKSAIDVEKLAEATKKAGEMALQAGKALANFTIQGVKVMAAAVTSAATALTKMAVDAGKAADNINTLSKITGIGTKELQEFQYASDVIDVSVETLAGSMKKITSSISSASTGSGKAYEAFNQLGVSFKNADGTLRNSNDVFNDTIKALGGVANETERDALAMQLFGKSATELNPLIEGGADTLAEMSQRANELGLILSQDTLDGANAFNDALDKIKANGKGLFTVIGSEIASNFAPQLESVNGYFEGIIQNLTGAMKEGGFEGLIDELSKSLSDILTKAIEKLPNIAKSVISLIKKIVEAIKQNASQMGEGAAELVTTLIEGLWDILPDVVDLAIKLVTAFIETIGNNLPKIIPTIVTGILNVIDTIVDNIDAIIDAGIAIIQGLIEGILKALPILLQKVPEILSKLSTTILENIPTIIEAITETLMMIIDFMTNPDNIMSFIDGTITLMTSIANALLYNLPIIIDSLINCFTRLVDRLTEPDTIDQLIDMVFTLITKVGEAMITNIPLLMEKIPTIIESLVNGFITLAPKLGEAAWTIITKLGEGLFEHVSELTRPIGDVFNWIKETMSNIFLKIKSVGENLIKGLWDGIAGVKDWIIRKIRQLCSDMLAAITSFFGIESPSKVMADKVGKYMAEGIGVGFGNTMPSVVEAMQKQLAGVTDAFQTELALGDIPQIQGNQVISENSYVTKNYTNTIETIRQPQAIELVLDGTKVARAIIPPLNSEYNRLGVKV